MKHDPIDYGIITAMGIEMEALLPWLNDVEQATHNSFIFVKGNIGGKKVVLCISDMGQTNAAIATMQTLYCFDPAVMIFCGIAGAVLTSLKMGDVVVGETIVPLDIQLLHDFNKVNPCEFGRLPELRFISDQSLIDIFVKANLNIKLGTIATSDYFPYPIDMPISFEGKPILSVDMESSAFSQCCKKMNKPFVVIRAISNVINKDASFSGISAEPIRVASQKAGEMTATFIKLRH